MTMKPLDLLIHLVLVGAILMGGPIMTYLGFAFMTWDIWWPPHHPDHREAFVMAAPFTTAGWLLLVSLAGGDR